MAGPYIPTQDAALVNWANNFSTLITASPATYGLTGGDATAISTVVDAYAAAYVTATDPSTRNTTTVAAKDAAKAAMLLVVRPYAQQIKQDVGVSNEDKAALGLNIDDGSPTPVPPPTTQPLINIVQATPLAHTMRYADAETPDSRAKPAGVTGLYVFRSTGTSVQTDPDSCDFYGQFTTQPVEVLFNSGDRGKICTYYGRWVNRKGEVGPWSNVTSFYVC